MSSLTSMFAGTVGDEAIFMFPIFVALLLVFIPKMYDVKADTESVMGTLFIVAVFAPLRLMAMKYFTEYVLSAVGNRISPTIVICVCMFIVSLAAVFMLLVLYSQFGRNTNAYYELFLPSRYIFWINILISAYLSIGAYVDGANFMSAIASAIPFFMFIKKLTPPE